MSSSIAIYSASAQHAWQRDIRFPMRCTKVPQGHVCCTVYIHTQYERKHGYQLDRGHVFLFATPMDHTHSAGHVISAYVHKSVSMSK